MDLTFSERETAFRDELRAWFAANDPGPEPLESEDLHFAWRRDFQRRLYDGGWAAPHWPVEYGGRGATLTESAIFFEELGRARAPLPANVLGLLLGGPDADGLGHRASRRSASSARSSRARRSGARASPSRTRAPTSRR